MELDLSDRNSRPKGRPAGALATNFELFDLRVLVPERSVASGDDIENDVSNGFALAFAGDVITEVVLGPADPGSPNASFLF